VIVTPYAHPILPLLYATDLHGEAIRRPSCRAAFPIPTTPSPRCRKRFRCTRPQWPRAARDVPARALSRKRSSIRCRRRFHLDGVRRRRPGQVVGLDAFTRDSSDVVQQPDDLYRPYYVRDGKGPQVAVIFATCASRDLVGSSTRALRPRRPPMTSPAALGHPHPVAGDRSYRATPGKHILDGENAWENYDKRRHRLSERPFTPICQTARRSSPSRLPSTWFKVPGAARDRRPVARRLVSAPTMHLDWRARREHCLGIPPRTPQDPAEYDLKGKAIAPRRSPRHLTLCIWPKARTGSGGMAPTRIGRRQLL